MNTERSITVLSNQKPLYSTSKILLLVSFFYLVCFTGLTWPWMIHFSTHAFADTGDGMQNLWNIWWINESITELHTHPWHTHFLHYPAGTSLLPQTMNPINGFLCIPMLKLLTLTQAHNMIVLISFVFSGVTGFWLAWKLTGEFWGSLFAGYCFTFSQYHFAHAQGHMQLISMEWIPLFVYFFYRLTEQPSYPRAVLSGLCLFCVILCDYYYFFYCVLTGAIIFLYFIVCKKKYQLMIGYDSLKILTVFVLTCLLTSGILAFFLLNLHYHDPLAGAHVPEDYSLDLLAAFIPGGHWKFSSLTQPYWSRLPGNIHESSVYLGYAIILMAVLAWQKRYDPALRSINLNLWVSLSIFFFLMALGPELQIAGSPIIRGIMPYRLLEIVFPFLSLSGCPVRMISIVTLGMSIIFAAGMKLVFLRPIRSRIVILSLILPLTFLELLPSDLPMSSMEIPGFVNILKKLPGKGALYDAVTPDTLALFHQTIHEKPLATGYMTRYQRSILNQLAQLREHVRKREYNKLFCDFNIRYLVLDASDFRGTQWVLEPLYQDDHLVLSKITVPVKPAERINLDSQQLTPGIRCHIDDCNGTSVRGWAFLPDVISLHSQSSILLKNKSMIWKLNMDHTRRPDVSASFGKPRLYDYSGFDVNLTTYELPAGEYCLGILVEFYDKKSWWWSDLYFTVS